MEYELQKELSGVLHQAEKGEVVLLTESSGRIQQVKGFIYDKWKCINCYDNFHEACDDLSITSLGVYKCKCVCNTGEIITR